jgi:hypothetical protein
MPNRILRDWTDSEKFDGLSADAERLFVRLIMKADDYGRFHGKPQLVKSNCFPQAEDLRSNTVAAWLTELSDRRLVFRYKLGNRELLSIINFRQRLKQSVPKFPPPDGECPEWAPTDGKPPPLPGTSRNFLELPARDGDGDGDGDGISTHTHPALAEVKAAAAMLAIGEAVAERFWHHYEASGWINKHSQPIRNWQSRLINWACDERARPLEQSHKAGGQATIKSFDIRNIIEAKKSVAAEIRSQHCREVAMGDSWQDKSKRAEYLGIMKEVKDLQRKLAGMA